MFKNILLLVAMFGATLYPTVIFSQEDLPIGTVREKIPYVPTPVEVVDRMLEMAGVTEKDTVYDLGSGDGRIVIRAAKKYGARGVGIELNPELIKLSRQKAKEESVSHLVEFKLEDALKADISSATVVTLFMADWFNIEIRSTLQRTLQPGSRIVSYMADMGDWEPDETQEMTSFNSIRRIHKIYLWRIR